MARLYRLVRLVVDIMLLWGGTNCSKDVEIFVLRLLVIIVIEMIVAASLPESLPESLPPQLFSEHAHMGAMARTIAWGAPVCARVLSAREGGGV
jgi:hypothetical protein